MYAWSMSIIVYSIGTEPLRRFNGALQTTIPIEIILSGNSIYACSSPEMEHFETNTI